MTSFKVSPNTDNNINNNAIGANNGGMNNFNNKNGMNTINGMYEMNAMNQDPMIMAQMEAMGMNQAYGNRFNSPMIINNRRVPIYAAATIQTIKDCVLPTQASDKLTFLWICLIPLLFAHIGLSFFTIITSSGTFVAGIYVAAIGFFYLPLFRMYPGFIAKYVLMESPDNPLFYTEEASVKRNQILIKRFYLGCLLFLACFVSIIVEAIEVSEVSSLMACASDNSFGDNCNNPLISSEITCTGDDKYYPAAANCFFGYTPNWGSLSLEETCKCVKSGSTCYTYEVMNCDFILSAYNVTLPIILSLDCVLLFLVGYVNYIVYLCLYNPTSFFESDKPNSISVIN